MITSESTGRTRRVAALLAAVVLSVLLTPLLAAPADAAGLNRKVTDSDIATYCRNAGYSGAVLTRGNAYGWQCTGPYGNGGVDMERLCSKPGLDGPFARVGNFYDPRSWQCWVSYGWVSRVTASDFSAYCRSKGYTGATSGADAYSWRCSAPNRATTFRVLDVCSMKSSGRVGMTDRFRSFYDPNSWECRQ